jgi:hypothetical protein
MKRRTAIAAMFQICAALLIAGIKLSPAQVANGKHDIRGFYPGMDVTGFQAARDQNKMSCNAPGFSTICHVSNTPYSGYFEFEYTNFLSPNVLWKVDYVFWGVKSPSDMVEQISEAYDSQPAATQAELQKPGGWPPPQLCGTLLGRAFSVWKLADLDSLILGPAEDGVINGEEVPGWSLMLCNEPLRMRDQQAYQHKRELLTPPSRF